MLQRCLKVRYISLFLPLCFIVVMVSFASVSLAEEDVIIIEEEALSWISENEAPKSNNNLLRIKFENNQSILSDEDKKAIDSMLKILSDPNQKIKIQSYANKESGEQKSREVAMQRMLNLRKNLIDMGFDISNANFFVFGSEGNKQNLDYIDIDKY